MSASFVRSVVPYTHVEQLREARAILGLEGEALIELSRKLDSRICDALTLLSNCRGCVIVTGIGKAGLIGQKIAATLSSTGTRAYFLHPTEALHGDLGCVGCDDVWLMFSNSGETEELTRLLPIIRNREQPIIAITACDTSTLGTQADVTICMGRLIEAGAHGLAPSTSTTVMLALGDALALVLSQMKQFTPQQFAAFHPGGSLGRRLASVQDVMRPLDQVRVAHESATIREVFVKKSLPGRRTGAVILIDDEGRLAGLFTDSDLARLLEQRRDDQIDRPISEVMTQQPLTVGPHAILEEALQVLGAKHVSELPVIDDERRPLGMVDITDVVGLAKDSKPS
ncbi:KpsF/GutQ family sugar-phosphate isomerase [Schlesneria paludicola]|uniref:KpsF/GutQ family sugar-phosphate isomerase n=1 Tax=Schlesneria paludicola TaxID=360056 RepID=UPI00029B0D40|nr:KpsF/GutQ family sugar-phosphate isomerase [Schlesneria paludicola]